MRGRRYWEGLEVRNMSIWYEADIAQAALDHLESAFNNGKLKPVSFLNTALKPAGMRFGTTNY